MNIEITSASVTDKSVIRQMMELYQYDFSEFTKADLNEHGHFGYPYLDNYWVELKRNPFLVRVNDKLAGFVLVHQNTYFQDNQYHLAEFFILRKYRQQGIGHQVAFSIFDLLRGGWEIYQAHTNLVAKKFWQNVIQEYTAGTYTETVMENDGWNGIIRCFDNTKFPS
ncbi:MAG: GNAT family N-acetyltransferase [Cyanobacteria bacterium P01_A01_bin.83]